MPKTKPKYLHIVSFRLTDEEFLTISNIVEDRGLSVNDWCRDAALEKASLDPPLSKSEKFLFMELARIHYLVSHGFRITTDETKDAPRWAQIRQDVYDKPDDVAALIARKIKFDMRKNKS